MVINNCLIQVSCMNIVFKKRNKSVKEYNMHILLSCSTFVNDKYKMVRLFRIIRCI